MTAPVPGYVSRLKSARRQNCTADIVGFTYTRFRSGCGNTTICWPTYQ